jgi:predicted transcriptional regulator of viral defense system
MDTLEKIQHWENEIERAEEYGFYFDIEDMREVVDIVKHQRELLEDLNESLFTERMKNEGLEIQISALKEEKSFFLKAYKDKIMDEK